MFYMDKIINLLIFCYVMLEFVFKLKCKDLPQKDFKCQKSVKKLTKLV